MAKYRKKQICVEAVQFDPKQLPWPAYIKPWSTTLPPELNHMGWIEGEEGTLTGKVPISPGEWVVTEQDGRRYVWNDETFKRSYEEI